VIDRFQLILIAYRAHIGLPGQAFTLAESAKQKLAALQHQIDAFHELSTSLACDEARDGTEDRG
jgi:hypothetical protein